VAVEVGGDIEMMMVTSIKPQVAVEAQGVGITLQANL
jgi:hypothetical protein